MCPIQRAPDDLVDIVVHAVGIADEAVGEGGGVADDARIVNGARIDAFCGPRVKAKAGSHQGDRELAADGVRDIGIVAQQRYSFGSRARSSGIGGLDGPATSPPSHFGRSRSIHL